MINAARTKWFSGVCLMVKRNKDFSERRKKAEEAHRAFHSHMDDGRASIERGDFALSRGEFDSAEEAYEEAADHLDSAIEQARLLQHESTEEPKDHLDYVRNRLEDVSKHESPPIIELQYLDESSVAEAGEGGSPFQLDSSDDLVERLRRLEPYDFERFVAYVWEEMGWVTRVTSESRDEGIDVIAEKNDLLDQRLLIQAKCYSESNKVGAREVQQYSSLQHKNEVDMVAIVTTGGFTRGARDRASELNVKLVDSEDLVKLIQKLNTSEIDLDSFE